MSLSLPCSMTFLSVVLAVACGQSHATMPPLGLGPLALAEQKSRASTVKDSTRVLVEASKTTTVETKDVSPKTEVVSPPSVSTTPIAPPSSEPPSTTNTGTKLAFTTEEWVGLYQGRDVTRYLMEGQPDRNYDDSKAKIRVERVSEKQIHFIFVDSSNGQDLCTLSGDVNGNEARLPEGQKCFVDPDENMTVNSRPGQAKHVGNRLTLTVTIDTTYDFEDGQAEGRIEYEFDGVK
jgi:hypothetical protein